jgi:hypothetical protein
VPLPPVRTARPQHHCVRPTCRSQPICVALPHHAPDGGAADGDASRYLLVEITNGQALGMLRAHLYDLGPKGGFKLVGIERPEP